MQESKIVATKRLQDEGHWNEASLYREGIRETLRTNPGRGSCQSLWNRCKTVAKPLQTHYTGVCYIIWVHQSYSLRELPPLFPDVEKQGGVFPPEA